MDRLVAASDVVVVTFVTPRSIAVENALQRIFLWFLQRRAVVFRGGVFVAELVLRFFGWGCEEGGGSYVVGLDSELISERKGNSEIASWMRAPHPGCGARIQDLDAGPASRMRSAFSLNL